MTSCTYYDRLRNYKWTRVCSFRHNECTNFVHFSTFTMSMKCTRIFWLNKSTRTIGVIVATTKELLLLLRGLSWRLEFWIFLFLTGKVLSLVLFFIFCSNFVRGPVCSVLFELLDGVCFEMVSTRLMQMLTRENTILFVIMEVLSPFLSMPITISAFRFEVDSPN